MRAGRYGRQVRLAEIGEGGQANIAASEADVTARGLAGEVEARYLAGAGVGRLRVSCPEIARAARAIDSRVQLTLEALPLEAGAARQPPLPFEVRDAVAREVAAGAFAALEVLCALVLAPANRTP